MAETSKRKSPLAIEIGQDVKFPIYQTVDKEKPVHVKNETFDFIPASSENAGLTYISINKLDDFTSLAAGNYDIISTKQLGSISLNYNRLESRLDQLDEDEIVEFFGANAKNEVKYSELSSAKQFSAKDIDKPLSYWKICIILTLIFVIAEMLLVRFLK
jgi:hypothetical protein